MPIALAMPSCVRCGCPFNNVNNLSAVLTLPFSDHLFLTTFQRLAFRQFADLALVVLGKTNEEIAALHFVVFAEEQIAEERFQAC